MRHFVQPNEEEKLVFPQVYLIILSQYEVCLLGKKNPYFQRFIGDICSVYISQKREHCLSFPLISISEYLFEETFFSAPFYEGTNRADIRVTTAKVFLAFFMW